MKLQYICFSLLILVSVLFLLPIVAVARQPANAVWNQTDFWFRDDDGAETSATGYGSPNINEDTNITNVAQGAIFRLRFGIRVTDANGTLVPRFEFKQGTDCTIGSWTTITSVSDTFNLRLSTNFSDGDVTTKQITNGSFVEGKILESANPASSLDLSKNKDTEYEWSLQAASSIAPGTTYSFRVSDNGTAFGNYEVCPALTTQPPGPPPPPVPIILPPSGGAGTPTEVHFTGRAYPGAKIMFVARELRQEIPFAQTISAANDGSFKADFVGILGGQQLWGFIVTDKDGRRTRPQYYNLDTISSLLEEQDIFVPPTIGFLRKAVTKGDTFVFIGYATPGSKIEFQIDNQNIKDVAEANDNGSYKLLFGTADMAFGSHSAQVRQIDNKGEKSDFSSKETFTISRLFVPKTDLNGDDIINIKDWSIFLVRWSSKEKSLHDSVDFNNDEKVDISDFSIFLRTIKR